MKKLNCYYFSDPHPGVGGAVIPLPVSLKLAAKEIDQQVLKLDDVIQKFREVGFKLNANIAINLDYKMITAKLNYPDGTIHSWRLISYQSVFIDEEELRNGK